MPNIFFDAGGQRAAKVRALFARIASRYDLLNDLQSFGLHRCWKRRLLRLAGARPGLRALDLCCGTGDLALGLARRGAEVVGLDFSPEMLSVARARAAEASPKSETPGQSSSSSVLRPLSFIQADAQSLPFPDNSFDIVTVGYGLRNLVDFEACLREMQRVAKPGGRLLALDFGKPDNALWRGIYFAYLKAFVPLLGLAFCGSAGAYAYILESLKHYPAQRGVASKMSELGLANIRIINLLGGAMAINYADKAG
jgi:demethylmenaquinone methyltransferase/2-methoxy-6-polyprenyl-1,4-benzoquinol methylase